MKWRVKLVELPDYLCQHRQLLQATGYRLVEIEASWYLTSDRYESFESAIRVREDAQSLVDRLRRIGQLEGIELSPALGSVFQLHPDGTENIHASIQSGTVIRLTSSATQVYASNADISTEERLGLQERLQLPLARARMVRIQLELTCPAYLTVQELMATPKTSPTDLGHIIDTIQDAQNGNMEELCSKAELTRFYRSINHPKAMGLRARHVVTNQEPPVNPMTEHEAKVFAHNIATHWLRLVELNA